MLGLDADSQARLAYLVLLLLVVGGTLVFSSHRQINRNLQHISVWALIFIGMVAAYGIRDQVSLTLRSGSPIVSEEGRVSLHRAYDGHFYATLIINGTNVQAFYQEAVDVGRVDTNGDGVINGDDGARRPWEYAGVLEVKLPKVWDGAKFVGFDTQSVCYDQSRLRQQLVRMEVTHPSGVIESVEMIKVDR